jgi:hypothetical protein
MRPFSPVAPRARVPRLSSLRALTRPRAIGVVLGAMLSTGCRDEVRGAGPGASVEAPPAEFAAIVPTVPSAAPMPARREPGPDAHAYFARQGLVEPPAEMVRLLPKSLPHKVVERAVGRGMDLMKAVPGRRFATVTLLTLEPESAAVEAVGAQLTGQGFRPDASTPAVTAFAHPDGQRVVVSPRLVDGQPLRLFLRWTAADAEPAPSAPPLSPEVAAGLREMRVVGFEESVLHAVVAGGTITDSARVALLVRAPSAPVRAKALAAWTKTLAAAGFQTRPPRDELWERTSTRETVVIRPTDDPAGDVLVSYLRRFRR